VSKPGSAWWLAFVGGLLVLAELTLTPLRTPLGWDEITYIAQTSLHGSPILMPPAHSRGAGLLAAPVTLVTTSVVVLRVWMALLSGAGLFLALLCWRGLRPARVLALAGVVLGSLAVTLLSGTQVMPNLWEALGALALAGLFLQAISGRMDGKTVLPLIGAVVFFLFLVRYQDALLILAPLVAGLAVLPAWRHRGVLAAIGAGLLAGVIEWLGESYAFYGGPASRLREAASQPPKLGLYFSLRDQLRVLDGPWYCKAGGCPGWRYPGLTAWWLALVVLVIVGITAGRRLWSPSSGSCVASAAAVLVGYAIGVPIAAPRYLLPVLALLSVPAADGMAWLGTRLRWRFAAIAAVSAFVLAGVVSQYFVQRTEVRGTEISSRLWQLEASDLHELGVRPPCVVGGPGTPVAYYLGCSLTSDGWSPTVLMPPALPVHPGAWHQVLLAGTPDVIAYVRCQRARELPLCRSGPRRPGPRRSGQLASSRLAWRLTVPAP
jgi:hypothetical protein